MMFKVGDRVRVVGNTCDGDCPECEKAFGQCGVFAKYEFETVLINMDDGNRFYTNTDKLELVEQMPTKITPLPLPG
jgi:threonine dehydrogenase-like Zn-dependent dehydrogenase